jgi:AAA+ ATPase superfamily predicted ATPase
MALGESGMEIVPFVGRQEELKALKQLLQKKTASLVVIKGRRRIGKSRLVEEFADNLKFYSFSGLPPTDKTTDQSQRDEFARQLGEQCGVPGLKSDDWGSLFILLAKHTSKGRVIILLDEISWMGSKDPDFLGKLKTAWDLNFKKNPQLMLVLCGSVSSWIEKNIISSAGFLGRISHKITLGELTLKESNTLLDKIGFKGSAVEKYMILAITGGVPWYLELVKPGLPASENIKKLCFEPDGILVEEFKYIFHDLFPGRRREIYRKIVECLAQAAAEYKEVAKAVHYTSSGPLSEYLDELIMSGFVSRDYVWAIKSGKLSKLSKYRLRDNYLRFYLRYIASQLEKIKMGQFKTVSLASFSGWDTIMGLQFENVILNNRPLVYEKLGIKPEEIVFDNAYFQRRTSKQKGCQIDYLIQTKYKTLYLCEVKFIRKEVDVSVIHSVEEKMSRLSLPRGYSILPVLIHVNGVSDQVYEKEFFYKMIDFSELLMDGKL